MGALTHLGVLVDGDCHQRPFGCASVIERDRVFIFIGDPSVAISAETVRVRCVNPQLVALPVFVEVKLFLE